MTEWYLIPICEIYFFHFHPGIWGVWSQFVPWNLPSLISPVYYGRTLRSRALKSSFICLLWSLKSWNICPYYFRFAGRICPPNSDGDEELLAFGIFTKSLFLHLLEQFELGHVIWKVLVYFWALERQDKMRLGVEDKSKYWISPLDGHLINVCYYLWFNFIPLQFFVSHHYSKVIRTMW